MPLSEPQREKNRRYINKRYHRRQHWIGRYKVGKGCELCGYNKHPFALDFDHLEPFNRLFLIPQNINRNLKVLFTEIRKCRVLCANCHRIVSFANKRAIQI